MPVVLRHYYPTLKVTSPPAIEPVTADDALAFAQYEGGDQASTDLMASLVVAARQRVETDAGIALVTQTRAMVMDHFPCGEQEIRLAPVQSMTASYIDPDGDAQALASGAFDLDTTNLPPRFCPAYGTTWPSTRCVKNAVTFSIVAGYGDDASSVPEAAKLAIKLLTREWFYNRCATGDVGDGIHGAYWSFIRQVSWQAGL